VAKVCHVKRKGFILGYYVSVCGVLESPSLHISELGCSSGISINIIQSWVGLTVE
jgi:hypothetical protein